VQFHHRRTAAARRALPGLAERLAEACRAADYAAP
jgi:hypothetical protein